MDKLMKAFDKILKANPNQKSGKCYVCKKRSTYKNYGCQIGGLYLMGGFIHKKCRPNKP